MPFDGLPEGLLSDMAKLRIALDGVRQRWAAGTIGIENADRHCALGWLLVATEWNRDEAVRLALDYVYPVLPEKVRERGSRAGEPRLGLIVQYNDNGSRKRVEQLFSSAVALAESRAVR